MSFQRRSEAFGTPSRVPEWVWKQVPFYWTCNGESPTTKRAATMSWSHQLVTVGWSKALTARDVRCTRQQSIRYWGSPCSADTGELSIPLITISPASTRSQALNIAPVDCNGVCVRQENASLRDQLEDAQAQLLGRQVAEGQQLLMKNNFHDESLMHLTHDQVCC